MDTKLANFYKIAYLFLKFAIQRKNILYLNSNVLT